MTVFRTAYVYVRNMFAGTLEETDEGYTFRYDSDMHLKNFSLLETSESSGEYVLSPAYDLLPVNANMPADKEQFALAMNGEKMNLRKNDFLKFADTCGISRPTASKLIQSLVRLTPRWLEMCDESLLPDELNERVKKISWKERKLSGKFNRRPAPTPSWHSDRSSPSFHPHNAHPAMSPRHCGASDPRTVFRTVPVPCRTSPHCST